MPSKMPPGWLELRNEMALRAAIRDRFVKDANKLPFHEVRPMPPITNEAIEQARREAQFDDQGRVVMPTPKPPEIRMQAGGVLNRMKGAAKNVAGNQGLNVLMGEDNPMWYGAGIGSMAALYHSPLNEDEVEYDRMRRLYAEMDRAGMSRPTSQANPAWKNPLPQFNPQEVIANYPNWAEMPAVDKARILKNYEDYKRMAPSGHRYGGGGGVKKQAVDLARRNFLKLRDPSPVEIPQHLRAMVISKQGDKALTKLESDLAKFHADNPDVFEKTVETVKATPISRRSVLKSAIGQAARNVLPMGEMLPSAANAMEAVQQVTQQAVPRTVTEAMVPGLVAEGLKRGLSFPRVMQLVQSELGTGMRNINEADIERMYENLRDPYSATDMNMFPNRTTAGDAFRSMTGVEGAYGSPLRQLRESMRSVREADPDLYETLKGLSRDIEHYGYEP